MEIACLWFFLPLPHPLGLPEGFQAQRAIGTREILSKTGPHSGLSSSIQIHQLAPSRQPLVWDLLDLSRFAAQKVAGRNASPGMGIDEMAPEFSEAEANLAVTRTIAEVAVPGRSGSEDEISKALDEAINHVRHLQRAVAMAIQRPVRLMSRATLPPFVPTYEGVLRQPGEGDEPPPPRFDNPLFHHVEGCAPPTALGLTPEPLTEDDLAKVAAAADAIARLGAFEIYADLRREATVQRRFDGNNRLAVVSLASAGEVLLDTALLHMLWEEHVAPSDAAAHFDRREGHTARVKRGIAPRLGGGWDAESTSPAGTYLRDLVRLRHRVVHAGHEPLEAELEAAWTSLFALEHFLGDLLANDRNLNRYLRTAMAWMGNSGIEKRDRWTPHVQQVAHDENEPNWIDAFARYRAMVDRELLPEGERPRAEHEDLVLYAERDEAGATRWVLHDEVAMEAALVERHLACDENERDRVEHLLDTAAESDLLPRVVMGVERSLPDTIAWVPEDDLFPELPLWPATRTPTPSPST